MLLIKLAAGNQLQALDRSENIFKGEISDILLKIIKMKFFVTPFKWILIFVATFILQNVESAKILAVFPFPGPSQYILVEPYLKALAAKGHEMTVINAFPQKQPISNFRDVPVIEVHANYAGKYNLKYLLQRAVNELWRVQIM